ncbi:MAG: hypothetical protein AB7S38_33165 [Vulcanimicrobiota bacterium]
MRLGTHRPGDGWFHLARDRFYRVWLATLIACLVLGVFESSLFFFGLVAYFLLCPVGLALAGLYLYRNLVTQEWVLDQELAQLLRVATWPTRSLVPVARVEELTGVALAAEETESTWVPEGPEATAEQVVYLLRTSGKPLAVSRHKFTKRAQALRLAQDLSEHLDLPLRLGGAQERLVYSSKGISFVPYNYEAPWKPATLTLVMWVTWPGLVIGMIGWLYFLTGTSPV